MPWLPKAQGTEAVVVSVQGLWDAAGPAYGAVAFRQVRPKTVYLGPGGSRTVTIGFKVRTKFPGLYVVDVQARLEGPTPAGAIRISRVPFLVDVTAPRARVRH